MAESAVCTNQGITLHPFPAPFSLNASLPGLVNDDDRDVRACALGAVRVLAANADILPGDFTANLVADVVTQYVGRGMCLSILWMLLRPCFLRSPRFPTPRLIRLCLTLTPPPRFASPPPPPFFSPRAFRCTKSPEEDEGFTRMSRAFKKKKYVNYAKANAEAFETLLGFVHAGTVSPWCGAALCVLLACLWFLNPCPKGLWLCRVEQPDCLPPPTHLFPGFCARRAMWVWWLRRW